MNWTNIHKNTRKTHDKDNYFSLGYEIFEPPLIRAHPPLEAGTPFLKISTQHPPLGL